ncbi:MAG: N-acetylmuramoyl-L-alanine amidase [Gammaproteobacteria bacterium]
MAAPKMNRLRTLSGVWIALLAVSLGLMAPSIGAHAATTGAVQHFQLSHDANGSRATLAVPAGLKYRVFTLSHPARVVLDLLNAQLAGDLKPSAHGDPLVAGIRYAPRFDGRGERLVFDLHRDAVPRTFLRHTKNGQAQLVLQLNDDGAASASAGKARTQAKTVITATKAQPSRLRDVVIAIDPGHGGRDSGAIGPRGLEEKNVTLKIAKDLYRRLAKIKGIKPVLTRTGNYYVGLAQRRQIAHKAHADLFISIHADSSPYHSPKGSTVYALSEHGASSVAARILADSENSVDKVAGINLSNEQAVVRDTILNLSQRGSIARSMYLARDVMGQINDVLPLHSDKIERAAFVVLKSPDIPSILVETAFISNRHEERQLGSWKFRNRIAAAITKGVKRYVTRYAPPGTLIAARRDALFTLKQG